MSAEVLLDNREKLEAAMCFFAMREGNHLNEKQCLSRLLSMDEVVSLYPEIEVSVLGESFVCFSCVQLLVDVSHSQSLQAARVGEGLFVISPYSFATLRTATDVLVFDSHAHGSDGALFACVPLSRAGEYLMLFFLSAVVEGIFLKMFYICFV